MYFKFSSLVLRNFIDLVEVYNTVQSNGCMLLTLDLHTVPSADNNINTSVHDKERHRLFEKSKGSSRYC